jgi:hypothetical protein
MRERLVSRELPADRGEQTLARLLREADVLVPRPPGQPITLATLAARARRMRRRALALALLLPLAAASAAALGADRDPSAAAPAGSPSRWLRRLEARAADLRLRELLSLQRAETGRERAAASAASYAERVYGRDPARAAAVWRQVADRLSGTHGARTATRLLASLPREPR